MFSKSTLKMFFLDHPKAIIYLRVLIIIATLIVAFFVRTGVVSADPGWGVVGG